MIDRAYIERMWHTTTSPTSVAFSLCEFTDYFRVFSTEWAVVWSTADKSTMFLYFEDYVLYDQYILSYLCRSLSLSILLDDNMETL